MFFESLELLLGELFGHLLWAHFSFGHCLYLTELVYRIDLSDREIHNCRGEYVNI